MNIISWPESGHDMKKMTYTNNMMENNEIKKKKRGIKRFPIRTNKDNDPTLTVRDIE